MMMFKGMDKKRQSEDIEDNEKINYVVSSKLQTIARSAAKKSVVLIFLNAAIIWVGSILYRILATDVDEHLEVEFNSSIALLVQMISVNHTHNESSSYSAVSLVDDGYWQYIQFLSKKQPSENSTVYQELRQMFNLYPQVDQELHSALHTFSVGTTLNLFNANHTHYYNYHSEVLDILVMHLFQWSFYSMVTSIAFTINCRLTIWLNKCGLSKDLKTFHRNTTWFRERYCLNQIQFSSKMQPTSKDHIDPGELCEKQSELDTSDMPSFLTQPRTPVASKTSNLDRYSELSINTNSNPQYTYNTGVDISRKDYEIERRELTYNNEKKRKQKQKRLRVALSDYSLADQDFLEISSPPVQKSVEKIHFKTRGDSKSKLGCSYKYWPHNRYTTTNSDYVQSVSATSYLTQLKGHWSSDRLLRARKRLKTPYCTKHKKRETKRQLIPFKTCSCTDFYFSLHHFGKTLRRSLTHQILLPQLKDNKVSNCLKKEQSGGSESEGSCLFSKQSKLILNKNAAPFPFNISQTCYVSPPSTSHSPCHIKATDSQVVKSSVNRDCKYVNRPTPVDETFIETYNNSLSVSKTSSVHCRKHHRCFKNALRASCKSRVELSSQQSHCHDPPYIYELGRNPQTEKVSSPCIFLSTCKRGTVLHQNTQKSEDESLLLSSESQGTCIRSRGVIKHRKEIYTRQCVCEHGMHRQDKDKCLDFPYFRKQNKTPLFGSFITLTNRRTGHRKERLVTDCLCKCLPYNTKVRNETNETESKSSSVKTIDTHVSSHLKPCQILPPSDKSSNAKPRTLSDTCEPSDKYINNVAHVENLSPRVVSSNHSNKSWIAFMRNKIPSALSFTSSEKGEIRNRLKNLKRARLKRLTRSLTELAHYSVPHRNRLSLLSFKRLKALVMMSRNPIGCDTDCFSLCSVCENEDTENRWDIEMLRIFNFRHREAGLSLTVFVLYLIVWTITASYVLGLEPMPASKLLHAIIMMAFTVNFYFADYVFGVSQSIFLILTLTLALVLLMTCLQTTLYKAPPPRLHGRNKVAAEIQRALEITYRRTYGRAKRLSLDLDVS